MELAETLNLISVLKKIYMADTRLLMAMERIDAARVECKNEDIRQQLRDMHKAMDDIGDAMERLENSMEGMVN